MERIPLEKLDRLVEEDGLSEETQTIILWSLMADDTWSQLLGSVLKKAA